MSDIDKPETPRGPIEILPPEADNFRTSHGQEPPKMFVYSRGFGASPLSGRGFWLGTLPALILGAVLTFGLIVLIGSIFVGVLVVIGCVLVLRSVRRLFQPRR